MSRARLTSVGTDPRIGVRDVRQMLLVACFAEQGLINAGAFLGIPEANAKVAGIIHGETEPVAGLVASQTEPIVAQVVRQKDGAVFFTAAERSQPFPASQPTSHSRRRRLTGHEETGFAFRASVAVSQTHGRRRLRGGCPSASASAS